MLQVSDIESAFLNAWDITVEAETAEKLSKIILECKRIATFGNIGMVDSKSDDIHTPHFAKFTYMKVYNNVQHKIKFKPLVIRTITSIGSHVYTAAITTHIKNKEKEGVAYILVSPSLHTPLRFRAQSRSLGNNSLSVLSFGNICFLLQLLFINPW